MYQRSIQLDLIFGSMHQYIEMCGQLVGGTNLVLGSWNSEKIWYVVIFFFYIFVAQPSGIVLPLGIPVGANVVQCSLGIRNCIHNVI